MNIIYLITNLSKTEGETRFYIGSKAECELVESESVHKIICKRTGRYYWGSSSNYKMIEDFKTDKFTATILEKVGDSKKLLSRENYHILLNNAVKSDEYYNLSEAKLGGHSYNPAAQYNKFGESLASYAGITSNIAKKNNTAVKQGFKNLSDMSLFIYEEHKKGKSHKTISKMLNTNNRAFSRIYIRGYNMEKFKKEVEYLNPDIISRIKDMYLDGASIKFTAKTLEVEIPTVVHYLQKLLSADKKFIVARRNGLSPEELENKILDLVVSGKTIDQACKELSIERTSGYRYFYRSLRKRLGNDDS